MLKAKQKTVSLVVACLTMLLTVLFAFAMLFAPTSMKTASAETTTVETSILGTTGTLSNDKSSISWTSGNVTFTNKKGSTAIRNSDSAHYRVYLGSTVTISTAVGNITNIVITCTSADYAKVCNTSLTNSDYTASVSGSVVTVSDLSANSIAFTSSAQWRLNKIVVTYEEAAVPSCEHEANESWSFDSATNEHYKTCAKCSEEMAGTRNACEFNEEVNGTTATFTCIECEYSYNAFQITYNYPAEVTLNGEETTWVKEGTKSALPTTTAPEGYVFAGWSTEKITEATTTKPTLYTDYMVTEATTFYAVYHNDAVAGGWNLVTNVADLATGDTVTIVAPSKNVAIGAKSGTYFTSVTISIANESFADTDGVLKLTLTKNSDNTYSFFTGTEYLAYTGSSNTLNTSASIANSSSWTLTTSSITNANSTTRKLQYNASSPRFACYTTVQTAVALYKYAEGSEISYTSVFCVHSETYTETEKATCTQDGATVVKCSNCDMEISREIIEATGHQNTTTTTVDATCTENGSITVTCDDCGEVISSTEIPATGHNLDEGVITTQPDVGVTGEKTYTCQNGCGYTETESIPALDATKYTITYSVPNGITAPASEELAKGETIILPDADSTGVYTFLGWVESTVEVQTARPEVYAADTEYTLTVEDNVTLYALYSYSTGSGNYVKVTENRDDWSGEYLIVYEKDTTAYIFNATDANNGYLAGTTDGSNIIFSDEIHAERVTISIMEGGYSILTNKGYIYGNSSSNKLTFTTTEQLNTIELNDDGTFLIKNNGSPLQFNSNDKRFRYYYKALQNNVYLYALDGATYYTTNLGEVVTDIDTASVTVGENLAMNYYVNNSNENATMYFTLNGETYDVNGVLQSDGRYSYSLTNIPPQCMTDNISVVLMDNETVLDKLENYSIQQYAQNMLNKTESSKELKQFLSAMLYYGEAAQNYKGYNTENLAATGVTNLDLGDFAEAQAPEVNASPVKNTEIDSYPAYFTGATVWFDYVNQIQVTVSTTDNVTLTVNDVEVELNGTTIKTEGILATEFDKEFVFKLYHDGILMQTLTYSVNAYAYRTQINSNADANMKALATALYRYGAAAKAYNA